MRLGVHVPDRIEKLADDSLLVLAVQLLDLGNLLLLLLVEDDRDLIGRVGALQKQISGQDGRKGRIKEKRTPWMMAWYSASFFFRIASISRSASSLARLSVTALAARKSLAKRRQKKKEKTNHREPS